MPQLKEDFEVEKQFEVKKDEELKQSNDYKVGGLSSLLFDKPSFDSGPP
jgi:hypothetical protein